MAEWLVAKVGKGYPLVITSRWHIIGEEKDLNRRASIDYTDLSKAHCILASFPYGFGTSSELGFALGANKHIIYFRPKAYRDDELLPTGLNSGWGYTAVPENEPVRTTVETSGDLIRCVRTIQQIEHFRYLEKKSGLADNIRPSIFGSESGSVR